MTLVADPRADRALLAEFYSDIMVPAFRPDELGEQPYWQDESGTAQTLLALDEDRRVLGGVVGELFTRSGVLLISWVAVRRGLRGQGTGTRLMEAAAREWYGDPRYRLVLGELDDPRYWPSEEQDPVARLRFYDRLGVRALTTPYFQPALGPSLAPVHHMFLAEFHPGAPGVRPASDAAPHGAVDGAAVRVFLEEYLEGSAEWCGHPGVLGEDAEWLLSYYDGSDIPLIPLLDYPRIKDPAPPGARV